MFPCASMKIRNHEILFKHFLPIGTGVLFKKNVEKIESLSASNCERDAGINIISQNPIIGVVSNVLPWKIFPPMFNFTVDGNADVSNFLTADSNKERF